MSELLVSIVLGTYNRLQYLQLTLTSIRREMSGIPHEIIVVDGGSTDGSLTWLLHQKDVILILQHNHGVWRGKEIERRSWGYFMNLGFKCARGQYICMLSDDCLLVPGAVRNGLDFIAQQRARHENVGAVAFFWRNWPDGGPYFVGLTRGGKIFVNHGLYLRSALEEVGFIDEHSFIFYYADADLCLRLWQQGYQCLAAPESFVEHHGHANEAIRSANYAQVGKDWQSFTDKWQGIFAPLAEGAADRIEKDYQDTEGTAAQFAAADSLPGKALWQLRRLFGRGH